MATGFVSKTIPSGERGAIRFFFSGSSKGFGLNTVVLVFILQIGFKMWKFEVFGIMFLQKQSCFELG